jgi:site-specific recombinase XerD
VSEHGAIISRIEPDDTALGPVAESAREYVRQAKASNTRRAYASDWRHFTAWCAGHGLAPLPASPDTVALYLSALAHAAKTSTIGRRVSSISQAHQMAGYDPPPTRHITVRTVLAGIRRTKGTAEAGKRPIVTEDLRRIVAELGDSGQGIRDRALLLVGFAGAFRRSELVGLDVGDLEFNPEGLVVNLKRSKTDQEGQGRKVGIPYGSNPQTCPIRAVKAWLEVLGVTEGPLFRRIDRHGRVFGERLSDRGVALIVKRLAGQAGFDSAVYAGHSLRAGLATAAASAGVSERAIMAQTGHRSLTTLRRYIREGSLFLENAAAKVGL